MENMEFAIATGLAVLMLVEVWCIAITSEEQRKRITKQTVSLAMKFVLGVCLAAYAWIFKNEWTFHEGYVLWYATLISMLVIISTFAVVHRKKQTVQELLNQTPQLPPPY